MSEGRPPRRLRLSRAPSQAKAQRTPPVVPASLIERLLKGGLSPALELTLNELQDELPGVVQGLFWVRTGPIP